MKSKKSKIGGKKSPPEIRDNERIIGRMMISKQVPSGKLYKREKGRGNSSLYHFNSVVSIAF